MDLREAVAALESNLAEDYPGEFLNVEALRIMVTHVRDQLEEIEQNGQASTSLTVDPE